MTFPTLVSLIALTFPPSSIQAQPTPKPVPAPVPSIEEVIARALQTHPEILVAEAKLAGAKAELELAKLALSQKIAKAKNRYDTAKQTEVHAERALARIMALYETKAVSTEQFELTREKAELAKTQRIEAEAEWKAVQPPAKLPMNIDYIWFYDSKVTARPLAEPSQAERDRYELLMRPLKMKKGEKIDLVEAANADRCHSGSRSQSQNVGGIGADPRGAGSLRTADAAAENEEGRKDRPRRSRQAASGKPRIQKPEPASAGVEFEGRAEEYAADRNDRRRNVGRRMVATHLR